MNPIYKTFFNLHIDLSRVLYISDAKCTQNAGHSSLFTFKIGFDSPVPSHLSSSNPMEYEYSRSGKMKMMKVIDKESNALSEKEQTNFIDRAILDGHEEIYKWYHGRLNNNSFMPLTNGEGEIIGLVNLQKQVDEIVKVWEEFKNGITL